VLSTAARTVPVTLIGGARKRRTLDVAELWAYRELLFFLVWRDAKVRYRQTVLGAAWAIIQPFFTMVVFSLFFGQLARIPSDGVPYPIFSYVALVPWTFFGRLARVPSDGVTYRLFALAALVPWTYFATALGAGAQSLVGQQHLIAKVYFPRLLMPLAAVLTPLVDFAIAFAFLIVMLVAGGVTPGVGAFAVVPYAGLAVLTALTASVWTAALNVEYRDVRYVLPFAIQFWLFATPVAYPASLVPERWRALYGLNPMATVVEGFRAALLDTPGPAGMVWPSLAIVIVMFALGLGYFRRVEGTFADVI
jgi:lipopolysaccharide transport system permease protein